MRRFATNRWSAILLALCVLLAGSAALPSLPYADGVDPIEFNDGTGGSGGSGDPDGPAGPNKRQPYGGSARPARMGYSSTTVGDGGTAWSVWSWRIHVVLLTLKIRYLR
jgi:hypothetical protein